MILTTGLPDFHDCAGLHGLQCEFVQYVVAYQYLKYEGVLDSHFSRAWAWHWTLAYLSSQPVEDVSSCPTAGVLRPSISNMYNESPFTLTFLNSLRFSWNQMDGGRVILAIVVTVRYLNKSTMNNKACRSILWVILFIRPNHLLDKQ